MVGTQEISIYDATTASTNLGKDVMRGAKRSGKELGQDITRPFVLRETLNNLFNTKQPNNLSALSAASTAINKTPVTLPGADRMDQLQVDLAQLQSEYKVMPPLVEYPVFYPSHADS